MLNTNTMDELRPHPVYDSFYADKHGNVYDCKKHKLLIDAKLKSVRVLCKCFKIQILHILFVWECFNGKLPANHEVVFDEYADGNFCDKVFAVDKIGKTVHKARQMNFIRQQMCTIGYKPHPQCPA